MSALTSASTCWVRRSSAGALRAPVRLLSLAFAAIGLPAAGAQQRQPPRAPAPPGAEPAVVLSAVTVVDVERGRLRPNQTVVVRGTRIAAAGPAAAVAVPRGARVVDGRGKYLIPGLWDAHVHFMNTGESALPLLVAHGVTGVREMGGYLDSTRAWRRRMAEGTLVGPRIVTPGPILESPQYLARVRERDRRLAGRLAPRILPYRTGIGDSADAARAVDSLVTLGVDFVKVRNTGSPAAHRALLAAAKRAGLAVAGHLPGGVTLGEASDAGQTTVEHLPLPPLSTMPPADRRALYARLARNGTWYTPTLIVSKAAQVLPDSAVRALLDDPTGAHDPRRRQAAPSLVAWWRLQLDERAGDPADPRRDTLARRAYESGLADVRGMRDAGVQLLAGTDAGSFLVYPGSSLHEELALLVADAKLTPREALWAATVGPARLTGFGRDLGAVAPGRLADLVLLDGDPLADIRNTARVRAVIANGRLLRRADLDALLDAAARAAAPGAGVHIPAPGRWIGGYTLSGRYVPMDLRLRGTGSGTVGTLSLPFDGLAPTALRLTRAGGTFHAELAAAGAASTGPALSFDAPIPADPSAPFAGTFRRGGAVGTFHLSRIASVDTARLAALAGEYAVAPDHVIDVAASAAFGWLTFTDRKTGRFGALFPESDTSFFGGPGRLVPYPRRVEATFRDDAGGVRSLTIREDSGAAFHARRVALSRTVEVRIASAGAELAGTLAVPRGPGPRPGLVLVHGSDPHTRFDAAALRYFARLGFVVLSYDKRGHGASTGEYTRATFDTLAADVQAALRFLRGRPEVDASRVGLWGISQGGWIAPLAAVADGRVAFMVLHAGPAVTPARQGHEELENTLRARGAPPEEGARAGRYLDLWFAALRDSSALPTFAAAYEAERARGSSWAWSPKAYGAAGAQWFARIMDYDPVPTLRRLRVPLLAIYGTRDVLVSPEVNVPPLERATAAAGNRDVTVRVLPNGNHRMEESITGDNTEFAITGRMVPAYYPALEQWLARWTKR